MSNGAKRRFREAAATAAAVALAAMGVGAAVAATSPSLLPGGDSRSNSAPVEAASPAVPPKPPGFSLLLPSSLTTGTASGLRVLAGTGIAVTGVQEAVVLGVQIEREPAKPAKQPRPQPQSSPSAAPAAPPSPAAPAPILWKEPEVDAPGSETGEERRSGDPSKRAYERSADPGGREVRNAPAKR